MKVVEGVRLHAAIRRRSRRSAPSWTSWSTGIVAAHDSDEFWQAYYGDEFEYSYQLATPGHLIQAAVAHHRATGQADFLDVALRVADAVAAKFEGRAFAEHACIEMALVELWRATGEARILRLARHFAALLMEQPPVIGPHSGEGHWRHFNCHVVRQTYLPAGAADLLAEQENQALSEQLFAIWRDMVRGKLQVTGHIAVDHWMPERITPESFALSEGALGTCWITSTTASSCVRASATSCGAGAC